MASVTDSAVNNGIIESNIEKITFKRKLDVSTELAENLAKHIKKEAQVANLESENAEAEYYFENGLRKVYPYYFTYTTFCKGRWVGKTLLQMFSEEFRAFSSDYYKKSIASGTVMVNGKLSTHDYVLKDNDCITNKVHRHEVGVVASPIKIVHLDEDLVVVDKPPSIPVHPCGRYRHNSLLFILAKEHGLTDLHTIHRLDRLTSGVMILCRKLRKSQELDELVRTHKLEKEYVCRVDGLFPDGIITCEEPIKILSPKIGICIASSSGKESLTKFTKMSYNGKSSVVRCMPQTGRMHQIRVHLQYLGYPIVNDPIYNSVEGFGPSRGKNGHTGKSKEKLLQDLMELHNLDKWLKIDEPNEKKVSLKDTTLLELLNHNLDMQEYEKLESKYKKDDAKFFNDAECEFCKKQYRDPGPSDLLLFLHAYRYKGGDWEFETELPLWAQENWTDM